MAPFDFSSDSPPPPFFPFSGSPPVVTQEQLKPRASSVSRAAAIHPGELAQWHRNMANFTDQVRGVDSSLRVTGDVTQEHPPSSLDDKLAVMEERLNAKMTSALQNALHTPDSSVFGEDNNSHVKEYLAAMSPSIEALANAKMTALVGQLPKATTSTVGKPNDSHIKKYLASMSPSIEARSNAKSPALDGQSHEPHDNSAGALDGARIKKAEEHLKAASNMMEDIGNLATTPFQQSHDTSPDAIRNGLQHACMSKEKHSTGKLSSENSVLYRAIMGMEDYLCKEVAGITVGLQFAVAASERRVEARLKTIESLLRTLSTSQTRGTNGSLEETMGHKFTAMEGRLSAMNLSTGRQIRDMSASIDDHFAEKFVSLKSTLHNNTRTLETKLNAIDDHFQIQSTAMGEMVNAKIGRLPETKLADMEEHNNDKIAGLGSDTSSREVCDRLASMEIPLEERFHSIDCQLSALTNSLFSRNVKAHVKELLDTSSAAMSEHFDAKVASTLSAMQGMTAAMESRLNNCINTIVDDVYNTTESAEVCHGEKLKSIQDQLSAVTTFMKRDAEVLEIKLNAMEERINNKIDGLPSEFPDNSYELNEEISDSLEEKLAATEDRLVAKLSPGDKEVLGKKISTLTSGMKDFTASVEAKLKSIETRLDALTASPKQESNPKLDEIARNLASLSSKVDMGAGHRYSDFEDRLSFHVPDFLQPLMSPTASLPQLGKPSGPIKKLPDSGTIGPATDGKSSQPSGEAMGVKDTEPVSPARRDQEAELVAAMKACESPVSMTTKTADMTAPTSRTYRSKPELHRGTPKSNSDQSFGIGPRFTASEAMKELTVQRLEKAKASEKLVDVKSIDDLRAVHSHNAGQRPNGAPPVRLQLRSKPVASPEKVPSLALRADDTLLPETRKYLSPGQRHFAAKLAASRENTPFLAAEARATQPSKDTNATQPAGAVPRKTFQQLYDESVVADAKAAALAAEEAQRGKNDKDGRK
ncbi:hypothetical protein K461DRAFT_290731 [Myriangium duriaei CBS 260.36]|uniref:Uncharacterized protein n=1 Tax=Myriangium duriaei CBS 260.36 TaxID=1168546 RepID=A0A9P4JB21_9PEZI|nr:hypothetical protein K461DRAFT_290731 [Myriangium duriaei CBS 260.36]